MIDFNEGVIIPLDKPYGVTSFKALARVRTAISRRLGVKKIKIGHAGTLDPLATGVLILCTGKATKRIEELQAHTKEYVAVFQLGATTPSYDMEHDIDNRYPTEHITREMIDTVLRGFIGEIEQVPPSFSACKINGKRAYKLSRKGEEVELKPKKITIDEIEVLDFDPDAMLLRLRIVCGKGTYIRAMARDIGEALGSGAYLKELRRTRVGEVRVEDCLQPDDLDKYLDEALATE